MSLITTSNLTYWIVHTERYLSKGKTTRTATDVICPNIINFRECRKRHKIHSILFLNFLLPSRQCKDIKVCLSLQNWPLATFLFGSSISANSNSRFCCYVVHILFPRLRLIYILIMKLAHDYFALLKYLEFDVHSVLQ